MCGGVAGSGAGTFLLRIGVLGLVVCRLVRYVNSAVFHGMRTEVRELIDLDFLRTLEEPAKIVPEERGVADFVSSNMAHLMEGHEGYDILVYEFLALIALTETHIDLLALVNGVARVAGVGGGFREARRRRVEIAENLGNERLICVRLLERGHQTEEFRPCTGEPVGGLLLVGQVADQIAFAVYGAFDVGHFVGALFVCHGRETSSEETGYQIIGARRIHIPIGGKCKK